MIRVFVTKSFVIDKKTISGVYHTVCELYGIRYTVYGIRYTVYRICDFKKGRNNPSTSLCDCSNH